MTTKTTGEHTENNTPESKVDKPKEKVKKLIDYITKPESEIEDAALVADLIDEEGKIKADMSMPSNFKLEIMAAQMVEAQVSYQKSREINRAARNSGDGSRADLAFKDMSYNQLVVAIIQNEFKGVKEVGDDIMRAKAAETKLNRAQIIKIDGGF